MTKNATLGATALKNVSHQQVEQWKLNALAGKGYDKPLMPATVKRALGDLKRVLSLAVENGDLRSSPVASIRPPRVDDESEKMMLTDPEVKRLENALSRWEYINTFPGEFTPMERRLHPRWFALYVRLLYHTGGRRNEVLFLRWEHIDFTNQCVVFPGTNTKSQKTRRVPISDELMDAIRIYAAVKCFDEETPESEERLFPVNEIRKPWQRLMDEAKLKGVTPHTLRHNALSEMVQAGASLATVRDLAGHSNISVTSRYLKVLTRDKQEAVNLIGRREDLRRNS